MTNSTTDAAIASGKGEFRSHWRALLGCTLAASVGTIGLNAYSQGAFVPALVAGAGYTREQLSLATLLLSATVALIAPFIGQALDRWEPLRIIAFAIAGEAAGFAYLAFAPAQFVWFAGGMIGLALLGAGTTPPSFARVVAAHFDRHRGLALGIMISGLGLTAITAPLILTRIIALVGWRGGYGFLAALVLAFGIVGYSQIRKDPPPTRSESDARGAVRGDWSALGRPLYWYILLCFAMPSLFGAGYLLHLITILRERGFDPTQAAQVQGLVGASIVLGRLTSGFAMDRVFAPYVAAAAFLISAAGTAMLLSSQSLILCVAALGVGLTIGAELDILAFTLSRYFGVPSFGRLYGLAYSTMISPGERARSSSPNSHRPAITRPRSLFLQSAFYAPPFSRRACRDSNR